jgi:hypothetical protein
MPKQVVWDFKVVRSIKSANGDRAWFLRYAHGDIWVAYASPIYINAHNIDGTASKYWDEPTGNKDLDVMRYTNPK